MEIAKKVEEIRASSVAETEVRDHSM